MNIFIALREFHTKFKMRVTDNPRLLNPHLFEVRAKFMHEELVEFINAHEDKDMAMALDGLIDLIYVAAGTIDMMGFTPEQAAEAFRRVHEANLRKVLVRSESESKRKTLYDVKKPVGWEPPDLEDLCR